MLRRRLIQMKRHIRPNLVVEPDLPSMLGLRLGIAAIEGPRTSQKRPGYGDVDVSRRGGWDTPAKGAFRPLHAHPWFHSICFVSQDELGHLAAPGHEVDHSETTRMSR